MKKLLFLLFLSLFGFQHIKAQGCSDAGICSIDNSLKTERANRNLLEVGTVFGIGETDLTYLTPYATYLREITKKLTLSAKVTFSVANGSFGTVSRFGDIYLIGNYKHKVVNERQWSNTIGIKIPLSDANEMLHGMSLPMDYQPSLGTFDLIGSTNFRFRKWEFNLGIQFPVFHINNNSYFAELAGTNDFPSTNEFIRRPDALFRSSYTYKLPNSKFSLKPNVLFLYHINEDTFKNMLGERETIDGSNGLTINGNLISVYHINATDTIELSLAAPFVIRDARPDGLTREFTAGLSYKVNF